MADITKSSDARLSDGQHCRPQSALAGAEIAAGDACYLDSNGYLQKVVRPTVFISGSYGLQVKFDGLAFKAIPSGTTGEIYGRGSEWFYADSALVIGSPVFPSATAGKLADAAVAAPDQPVAKAVSATNIILLVGV